MSGVFAIGPVRVRVSWRGLARWGYPVLECGGVALLSRHNNGDWGLISYHPRRSPTWFWSVALSRRDRAMWSRKSRAYDAQLHRDGNPHAAAPHWSRHFVRRDAFRRSQWHDHYRLPFGWTLVISHQDYHRERPA